MAVVDHHRLFKNSLKVVSFEFAGFAGSGESGEFKGGLGNDVFGTPKTRVNKFCDWAGFSRVHSERLTIVKLQNFSPIAEIRDLNLEFFRKKKTFFSKNS